MVRGAAGAAAGGGAAPAASTAAHNGGDHMDIKRAAPSMKSSFQRTAPTQTLRCCKPFGLSWTMCHINSADILHRRSLQHVYTTCRCSFCFLPIRTRHQGASTVSQGHFPCRRRRQQQHISALAKGPVRCTVSARAHGCSTKSQMSCWPVVDSSALRT